MTNTNTRQTLKTSFVNNTKFMYTDEVGTDYVRLTNDAAVINTNIDFSIPAIYVVLKLETVRLDFAVAEYTNIVESYDVDGVAKIKINLPIVNDEQVVIPYSGAWRVSLYNHRESERQSLSTALKPKADL
jgi:hypothetical protein